MKRFLILALLALGAWTHGRPSEFLLPLKIGGGGWNTGNDVCTDGQYYARTDTYGAYKYNKSTTTWTQVVTQTSMPVGGFGFVGSGTSQVDQQTLGGGGRGVYDIHSAPSNCSVVYLMAFGYIWRSSDAAATWVKASGSGASFFGGSSAAVAMSVNGTSRMNGRKMAVHPTDPDTVFAGTDTLGMYKTTDGGTTWTKDTGVPDGTGTTNYNIAFDPATPTTIYAFTNGATAGVYATVDGGANWSLTPSGPASANHLVVAQSGGTVWVTAGVASGGGGKVWSYTGGLSGTWTNHSETNAPTAAHSVAVDPADANRIVAYNASGAHNICTLSGATCTWTGTGTITRSTSAGQPGWLAITAEYSMSNGDTIFDPTLSNVVLFSEGIGSWTSSPASGAVVWANISSGIEQMVSRDVIAPSGVPIVGISDRSVFYLSDPTTYPDYLNAPYYNSYPLFTTIALDWAKSDHSFIVGNTADIVLGNGNMSGFSSDGGSTWYPFNSYYEDVASSALADDGTGQAQITVSSTTGLTTWAAGSGTIVRVVPYNLTPNSCSSTGTVNSAIRRYFYASIPDTTHIILVGSTFAGLLTTCGRLKVYVDTNPLTTMDRTYTVTGTANSGGLIQISVTSMSSSGIDNSPVCLSGVGGTTEANGCWVATGSNAGANTFKLASSVFANAWTSGGLAFRSLSGGGNIAASTSSNIVIMSGNRDYPQCTLDGGLTWTELTSGGNPIPDGFSPGGNNGWVNSTNIDHTTSVADPVTANRFWLYNYAAGTYQIDGCTVTALQPTLISNSNFSAKMRGIPGYAGHLLFAIGSQGAAGANHPQGGALRWSNDGGTTWTSITNTAEPVNIGVGAVAPGSDYPTIYMVGWVGAGNVFGVWRTTATAAQWAANSVSWTSVATYPLGSGDISSAFGADQLTWNKWYLGWHGSSFSYGQQN